MVSHAARATGLPEAELHSHQFARSTRTLYSISICCSGREGALGWTQARLTRSNRTRSEIPLLASQIQREQEIGQFLVSGWIFLIWDFSNNPLENCWAPSKIPHLSKRKGLVQGPQVIWGCFESPRNLLVPPLVDTFLWRFRASENLCPKMTVSREPPFICHGDP